MSTSAAPAASATLSKELFDELIRCPRDGLDAYLGDICDSTELEGTRASVHCRFLLADGNGRPRFSDLARRVAQELVDYAIPREASARAREKDAQGNPDLEAALLRYLDPDDPMFLQLEYRGACLVGFDSGKYPANANTMVSDEIKAALASITKNWHKSIGTHLTKHKIATFHLEVFCLPFPSIERFRKAFLKEIGVA